MNRFFVEYEIFSKDEIEVKDIANSITIEETVEIPEDIIPEGFIKNEIVGKVENIKKQNNNSYSVKISYSEKCIGNEILQLLNVIHGNSSMFNNVKVLDIEFNKNLSSIFPGPKFGIQGLRKIFNHNDPIIAPVIKPQGLSSDDLAKIAYNCAIAGADLIKEDHNIVNQDHSPYKERVEKISLAVKKANNKTGNKCLYFPHIASNYTDLLEDIQFAKDYEVGGIMLIPSLVGYSLIFSLSKDNNFNLPILTHPSFSGAFVLSNNTGFSYGMYYGKIQRIIGSDMSIFPNVGGRFQFTKQECASIADACRSINTLGKPIFPSIGGGMSLKTADSMKSMYGNNAVYLLGGSLLRYGDNIGKGIAEIKKALLDKKTTLNS